MHQRSDQTESDRPKRASAFLETGLFDDKPQQPSIPMVAPPRPRLSARFRSKALEIQEEDHQLHSDEEEEWEDEETSVAEVGGPIAMDAVYSGKSSAFGWPRVCSVWNRLGLAVMVIACAIGLTQYTTLIGDAKYPFLGATGVPLADAAPMDGSLISKRDNSPTDVCKRWAQQSALVNGTLFLYGGRATTSPSQTSNTWNNDFITIDLTKTWQISSPPMSGLPQPSGPPPISDGYLWNSYDSLFLYGGEFSDNPQGSPTANSLWEYDIKASSWKEHTNPQTSSGTNSESAGQPIQRAAEGAGCSVSVLGRGYYFGGHLDFLTTQGWSIQSPRLYLKSFIEYTFPGYAAPGGLTAGSDGYWRNITSAGIQEQAGFTERADGIVLFIPGFGDQGILLSLAGGTNETFTQMNEVDVYDIANSTWYRQATSGKTPNIRVNPCAVVAAAADGSSYNVYMFGGQNLIPYGNQTQYNDMWILSVPSFTWIPVNMNQQSVPYARAGHTCNVWDGQMIVVGGYIGTDISCEQPGVYIFNLSSLSWQNQFTALTQGKTGKGANPFSQQVNQEGDSAQSGLQGSYGYLVPQAVISAIGGNPTGGATITAPVASATAGPLASGRPITYTLTGPSGQTITETSTVGAGGSAASAHSGPNIGAIVAGVIAGLLFILACYLGFCALVYRKQLQLYKNHVAAVQRAAANPNNAEKAGFFAPLGGIRGGQQHSSGENSSRFGQSSSNAPSSGGPGHKQSDSYGGQSSSSAGRGSGPDGYTAVGRTSNEGASSSSEDLLGGMEPSFVGVVLHPRRSLRVVNRD